MNNKFVNITIISSIIILIGIIGINCSKKAERDKNLQEHKEFYKDIMINNINNKNKTKTVSSEDFLQISSDMEDNLNEARKVSNSIKSNWTEKDSFSIGGKKYHSIEDILNKSNSNNIDINTISSELTMYQILSLDRNKTEAERTYYRNKYNNLINEVKKYNSTNRNNNSSYTQDDYLDAIESISYELNRLNNEIKRKENEKFIFGE